MSYAINASAVLAAPTSKRTGGPGWLARLRLFLAVQRASSTLERLPDSTLADIGVVRDQVPELVRLNLAEHYLRG